MTDICDFTVSPASELLSYRAYEARETLGDKEKKVIQKRIAREKRKRHQIYATMDYVLSVTTYFDFFSADAFEMVVRATDLIEVTKKKQITNEFLLVPFLRNEFAIAKVLREYNFNFLSLKNSFDEIEREETKNVPKKKKRILEKIKETANAFLKKIKKIKILKEWFGQPESYSFDPSYFSEETMIVFDKCANNALERFKTPVITPEVLFITLMEEKSTKSGQIIEKLMETETRWYLLRYRLLKILHAEEAAVRYGVTKNQRYFAYLLKTQLSEKEFGRLLERDLLEKGVSLFRDTFISSLLSIDLLDLIIEDINKSMRITSDRVYSDQK